MLPGTIKREKEERQEFQDKLEGKEMHHRATQILWFQALVPPEIEKLKRLLESTQSACLAQLLYQQEDRGVKGPKHHFLLDFLCSQTIYHTWQMGRRSREEGRLMFMAKARPVLET